MKKKLLFLALSILTVFTLVFVTLNNRVESDEKYIQEVDVIESLEKDDCAYFANLIYDDGASSWNENTAIGGAIGLIISCAIADSIKSSSSVSVGSGTSGNGHSAVPTGKNVTFDDVLNLPDIADKMAKAGASKETILEIIEVMTGLSIKEIEKKEDKVLAIGRYMEKEDGKWDNEAAYQVYAKNHGCLCYYSEIYDKLIIKYKGNEKMEIANIALVTYCAKDNWDFVFVTDPHYYVEENFISKGYKEKFGGGAYSMEISIIRKYGYVNFVNSNVTWASIIASPIIPNDGFALAGYRISR